MHCTLDGYNSTNRVNKVLHARTQASIPVKPKQTYAVKIFCRGGRSFEVRHNPPPARPVRERDVTLQHEQRGQLQELLATRFIIFVMP